MPGLLSQMLITAAGGAVGVLCRYGVLNSGWLSDNKFWYTAMINITGCLIIGVLWAVFRHWEVSKMWSLCIFTGMLGGYTTFSTFSLDAMQLIEAKMTLKALIYVSVTIIGGLGACAAGWMGTEKIIKLMA